jgi:hypothetical protein
MVRTAAVAGTAQAVRGRVARRQAENFAERDADIAYDRQQAYRAEAAQSAPDPAPAPGADATIDQLKQLGELRDSGVLTDDEFAAQKARILGTA